MFIGVHGRVPMLRVNLQTEWIDMRRCMPEEECRVPDTDSKDIRTSIPSGGHDEMSDARLRISSRSCFSCQDWVNDL